MNAAPKRFLVVSYGSIGRRHLGNVRTLYPEAATAVLRRPSSVNAEPAPPQGCARLTSMEAALEWGPDAALICSPAPFHLQQAAALVDAGVHVCIEKPLGVDGQRAGVVDLKDHVAASGVTAMLAYPLRFHRPLAALAAAWRQGVAGQGRYLRAHVGTHLPDWRPSQPFASQVSAQRKLGGGALLELSHELDLVLWLWGMPETVRCTTRALGGWGLDVEDLAELTLGWADGRVASIHLDMLDRSATRSLRVVGSDASLHWDMATQQARALGPAGAETLLDDGVEVVGSTMYFTLLQHFVDCIQTGQQPLCGLSDGDAVLRLVEAAREAATTGQEIKL